MGAAWAAGAEGAHEPSFFGDAETWVAVAFLLFVALVGRILWTKITALLDKRASDISRSLNEAERLRADAAKAKGEAERTLAQATAEAEAIVNQAREEVLRMQKRAAASLETAMALREQQALDRISQAEAGAAKQVRDTAVDVALSATQSLLREQVGGAGSEASIDAAIAELPRRFH